MIVLFSSGCPGRGYLKNINYHLILLANMTGRIILLLYYANSWRKIMYSLNRISGLIILALLSLIIAPAATAQEREIAIIPMEEMMKLISLLDNLEVSIVQHEWVIIKNAFLDPAYVNSLGSPDAWKDLRWLAELIYPQDIPETPAENTARANSIKVVKHFISEINVFKEPGCVFLVNFKGVRSLEFDLGKKFIPFDIQFCQKDDGSWLLMFNK